MMGSFDMPISETNNGKSVVVKFGSHNKELVKKPEKSKNKNLANSKKPLKSVNLPRISR